MFVGTKEIEERVHTIFVTEHNGREVSVKELNSVANR